MTRVVYANCHPGELAAGDLLVTAEATVAHAAPPGVEVVLADERFDPGQAQAINEQVWRLAAEWAVVAGEDVTTVEGVSAADAAVIEASHTVLLPAARAVLEAAAISGPFERLVTVVAETGDRGYEQVERIACEAFAAAVGAAAAAGAGAVPHEWRSSADPRNAGLVAKYAATRNPPFRTGASARARLAQAAAAGAVNVAARLTRRSREDGTVLVHEYGPTGLVAARWGALAPAGAPALVRSRFTPAALRPLLRRGDRAFTAPRARPGAAARRVQERLAALLDDPSPLGGRFQIAGVDLTRVVLPRLAEIATAYAQQLEGRVGATRRRLRRSGTRAVLVPFDGATDARALVRAAQAERIPTVVLNDGWKGDDHQIEGMAADHALALSASIREHYLARRADHERIRVTGDPRSDTAAPPPHAPGGLREVLVGSFTFSPVDLNCRRSDGERFLEQVLAGIAASAVARARITLKLHPADRPDHYAAILERHAALDLEVVTTGDVLDRIPAADVYVTTYSTSLLYAAQCRVPFAYYRVIEQHLHQPFRSDPVMDERSAATPERLAAMLDALAAGNGSGPVEEAWIERYAGPRDGLATRRVVDAVLELAAPRPPSSSAAITRS